MLSVLERPRMSSPSCGRFSQRDVPQPKLDRQAILLHRSDKPLRSSRCTSMADECHRPASRHGRSVKRFMVGDARWSYTGGHHAGASTGWPHTGDRGGSSES